MKHLILIVLLFSGCTVPVQRFVLTSTTECQINCVGTWGSCLDSVPVEESRVCGYEDFCARALARCMEGC